MCNTTRYRVKVNSLMTLGAEMPPFEYHLSDFVSFQSPICSFTSGSSSQKEGISIHIAITVPL